MTNSESCVAAPELAAVIPAPQRGDRQETPQHETPLPIVELFGMRIARTDLDGAAQRVLDWSRGERAGSCRYVVTPNVDQVVLHRERADLRAAYDGAAMVTADGAPLVAVARLLGSRLPERVAGSDLVPRLLTLASIEQGKSEPLRVFLLGAGPGVAERAANEIHARWPGVSVVGTHCPPLGFEHDDEENERILAAITAADVDLLVVGLGAPKQELWVHRFAERLEAKAALCVGATIDFLAGEKSRAPVWMRRTGLEWLHRLATEPRRLARRYARDAWVFPRIVWDELRSSRRQRRVDVGAG
ncbi:putative N-acetylmannosaminyltransferase [Pseudobythopirellula maris]|uniref:Putative N-acetylmannosaminyltransferase n=1 Tax=Pseudobythopirellula maris TaxID=2527991 RepID=A0A5C5ZSF4_9BACT|nr:WecB/TagA/CpsF family glycosyltransferase [Pseudobythopirellula maris]TWT89701.1 putative N-acetylmannosaminyltransferase [Pseudobythopirellula maris]